MKKILLLLSVMIGFAVLYSVIQHPQQSNEPPRPTSVWSPEPLVREISKAKYREGLLNKSNTAPADMIVTGKIIQNDTFNVYKNSVWGFQFNFPAQWVVVEPEFFSAASVFNMYLYPENNPQLPNPIQFNITRPEWWNNIIEADKSAGIPHEAVTIGGTQFYRRDTMSSSIPSDSYFGFIDDRYWLNIIHQRALKREVTPIYQKEFQMIVDSFEFIPL